MKNIKLQNLVESILFESDEVGPEPGHVQYGLFDRPIESDPAVDTPISTDPLANTESLLNPPPVEDPEYVPTSISELSLALYALAKDVPSESISPFFLAVRKKVDELQGDLTISEARGGGYFGDDDDEEDDDLDVELGAAAQYVGSDDPSDEVTYDELADMLGYSAASGVRRVEQEAMSRMGYILKKLKPGDFDKLMDEAVEAFALGMQDLGIIDEEDVAALLAEKQAVKELPSFRYYFNAAFVMPAYAELERRAKQRVTDAMDRLDITEDMKEFLTPTIYNQLTGHAKKNTAALLKKLQRGNPSKKNPVPGLDPELAEEVYAELLSIMPSLEAAADFEDDLINLALEMHSKKSSSRISKEIKKALAQVDE